MAGNDLAETAVHRVADLDEVLIKQDEETAVEAGGMRLADKLHHHAAGYVAVFVDVDGTLRVDDEEFAVAETEHA